MRINARGTERLQNIVDGNSNKAISENKTSKCINKIASQPTFKLVFKVFVFQGWPKYVEINFAMPRVSFPHNCLAQIFP
ncbi:MAG: hypothetical protein ACI9EW_003900 [Cellvibrionaceae bacterium]|jgi:hypothetical protein